MEKIPLPPYGGGIVGYCLRAPFTRTVDDTRERLGGRIKICRSGVANGRGEGGYKTMAPLLLVV